MLAKNFVLFVVFRVEQFGLRDHFLRWIFIKLTPGAGSSNL
jgi:hypothetical protein